MALPDDGDPVRAYGFVAIYFAELEALVDETIEKAASVIEKIEKKPPESIPKRPFSQRINLLERILDWSTLNPPDFPYKSSKIEKANRTLSNCIKAAEERNDTIHSPIYAKVRERDIIRHSRRHGITPVTSSDVYGLANGIKSLWGAVMDLQFTINEICGRPRLS